MHVLMTVHGQPPELVGGTERHVETLSAALVERGHEVTVLAGTLEVAGEVGVDDRTLDCGVRVLRLARRDMHFEEWGKAYDPGTSRVFGELLAGLRPDVVHVHHWLRLTTDLVRQSWRRGIPSVVSLHDYSTTCPVHHRILADGRFCRLPAGVDHCSRCLRQQLRPWRGAGETARVLGLRQADYANELRLANVVTPLSEDLRRGMHELGQEAAERMIVQPFTGTPEMSPGPPPAPEARPLRILNLGRVTPLKGQHVLLEAVARSAHPGAFEVHLRGPVDEATYAARLDELGTGLRVVRSGGYRFAELEREPFHLAVLPSLCRETHGLVLDEVQALGLPAFVSDLGAYGERLGGGGATFAVGDPDSLARLLDRALADADWLAALRAGVPAARPFPALVDFFEEQYRALVAAGPRDVADAFDADGHLEDLARRVDARERALWAAGAGDGAPAG